MSEPQEYVGSDAEPRPTSTWAAGVLTPEASAIAGFAFAVFSMLGQGSLGLAIQALTFGSSFGPSEAGNVFAVWAAGTLALAVLGLILAGRSLREEDAAAWSGHLARPAVVVAVVGVVISLIAIVGGLAIGRL